MVTVNRNTENPVIFESGYSLVEVLTVVALVLILTTIPIALVRKSREKVYEVEALKALRTVALAYENYWAVEGHQYPNYRSNGTTDNVIVYIDSEHIWDTLIEQKLLPRKYSGHPHNEDDLMATGYRFSIYPIDYGGPLDEGARHSYAFGMFPYVDSPSDQAIVMIRGQRFISMFPSTIPRNTSGPSLISTTIYTMTDSR